MNMQLRGERVNASLDVPKCNAEIYTEYVIERGDTLGVAL